MTNPLQDPDDRAHEKETQFHDEEQEIETDEVPVHRPDRASPRRPSSRRPPPKKWYHEE